MKQNEYRTAVFNMYYFMPLQSTLASYNQLLPFHAHCLVLSVVLESHSFSLCTTHHFSTARVYTVTQMTLSGL